MDFLIAATSTYSLAWLTSDERESVKMTREALLWLLPESSRPGAQSFQVWMAKSGSRPQSVSTTPQDSRSC